MKIIAMEIQRQLDELTRKVAQLEIELETEREMNSTLYDALKSHKVLTDELCVFLDDAHGRRARARHGLWAMRRAGGWSRILLKTSQARSASCL